MVIDCHNDTVLKILHEGEDFAGGSPRLHIDLPKMRSVENLGALFFAAWCDPIFGGHSAFTHTLEMLGAIRRLAEDNPTDLAIARTGTEVEGNAASGKISVVLAIEGGQPINDDLHNLTALYDEGVRLITLCHLVSPDWVGGCNETTQHGLTDFGFAVIRAMNEMGVIVDLAHASEQSVLDVAGVSTMPVLSSHSCAKGVFDTNRALSDAAIEAIAGTGGAVGIMFFPDVLAPRWGSDGDPVATIGEIFAQIDADDSLTVPEKEKRKLRAVWKEYPRPEVVPDVEIVFEHIDYAINLVGDDHVAIGSDYDGIPYACAGLEDIGKLGNLVEVMRRHGYAQERIENVMGLNVLRVMKAVLG